MTKSEVKVFKVGDKVVGIQFNGYNGTNEKCLLEVTAFNEAAGTFDGKCLAHKTLKEMAGQTFRNLRSGGFELATPEKENEIRGIKPKKDKPEQVIKLGSIIANFYEGAIESNLNKEHKVRTEMDNARIKAWKDIRALYKDQKSIFDFTDKVDLSAFDDLIGKKARKTAVENLIKFFVEFDFEPNFRFMNTLGHKLAVSINDGKNYIYNYFKLTDSPYKEAIREKMKSPEFNEVVGTLSMVEPSQYVNKRLKIYYGSQGTGKTTEGMKESEGRTVVCNNATLPDDLLQDFVFIDGKPSFNRSIMRECMEKGKPMMLDEVNLLPFETVRFLQGILDNKDEFVFKGQTIKIKDGFSIIGTMNLMVNGMAFGLPEPLVDRCYDIREFHLTADNLMSCIE